MKSISEYIRESIISEGPGAGYTVELDGLKVKDVKLVGKNAEEEIKLPHGKPNKEMVRHFEATLDKCVLDGWKAEGYYDGIQKKNNSPESVRTVQGGTIKGWVYLEDVEPDANKQPDNILDTDDRDIIEYIKDKLHEFKIEVMYGGGYSHSDLGNPIVFNDVEVETTYSMIYCEEITVKAPAITRAANSFFARR